MEWISTDILPFNSDLWECGLTSRAPFRKSSLTSVRSQRPDIGNDRPHVVEQQTTPSPSPFLKSTCRRHPSFYFHFTFSFAFPLFFHVSTFVFSKNKLYTRVALNKLDFCYQHIFFLLNLSKLCAWNCDLRFIL